MIYRVDIAAALINLASAAQKVEKAILQINLYPLDNATGFPDTYPLNSNLSGGSAINTIYYIRFIWCIAPISLVSVAQKAENAIHQAPVVQTLDSTIHRINHYPADKC